MEDNGGGDIGIDAVGNHAEVGDCAAGKQVQHLNQIAGAAVAFKDLLQGRAVDAYNRHMGGELIDNQDKPGEKQLVAYIRQPPCVSQSLYHDLFLIIIWSLQCAIVM